MTHEAFSSMQVGADNGPAHALMAQIHRRSFGAQDEKPWSAQSFAELIVSPGVEAQLYYAGDEPVGFSLVRSVCDEAELISLAIDPSSQRQGFARGIMQQLQMRLIDQKIARIFLEVRQDNQKAIQLYRALNFEKIGERRAYYQTMDGKRVDAHVFSLSLEK
jgi:[ribosomal protein S18]-alanine N-acetyltransferase